MANNSSITYGSFTDPRDGKIYRTVTIGNQTWMAKNLNYSGDGKIGVCYDKDVKNGKKYGRLYTWEEADKNAPEGWHLPSIDEWQELVNFAGGKKVAGKKLKAKKDWHHNGNGTDNYRFSALPGGKEEGDDYFTSINLEGRWWSATTDKKEERLACLQEMNTGDDYVETHVYPKSYLCSVRYVKDS